MTEDQTPKSALEIAMDRLKQRDADNGVVSRSTTAEQKADIAEARNLHAARLAELEILQRSKLAVAYEPSDRERLDAEYRDQLRRLNEELERKIERIRSTTVVTGD
jgi:hypothetical protein